MSSKIVTPKVSVVMPVYNGMPYIPKAVESILGQTFTQFELIVVNDCSTDDSLRYLDSLHDQRIVTMSNTVNRGVTYTLQRGLEASRGAYVARLDSDDIAYASRIEKQVAFLDENPAYGLVGSSYRTIDEHGTPLSGKEGFVDDLEIRWKMLFKSPFIHSTIMFRKSIADQYGLRYENEFGEDYHLWSAFVKYTQACILGELLIDYRVHGRSWTYTKMDRQVDARLKLSFQMINDVLLNAGKEALAWERYLDYIDWKRTSCGDSIMNVNAELELLNSFSTLYQSHPQLKSLRKRILNTIVRRLGKQVLSNPRLSYALFRNIIR